MLYDFIIPEIFNISTIPRTTLSYRKIREKRGETRGKRTDISTKIEKNTRFFFFFLSLFPPPPPLSQEQTPGTSGVSGLKTKVFVY